MSPEEMHYAVQQGLQRQGSYDYEDLLGEEIDLQLNRGVGVFVKNKVDKSNADPLGFEQTQKRLDDIQSLIVSNNYVEELPEEEVNFTEEYSFANNNYSFPLPDDYFLSLRIDASVKRNSTCNDDTAVSVPVRIIRNNQVGFHMNNPFSTTKEESPIGTIKTNGGLILTDGVFRLVDFQMEYIKQPAKIITGSKYISPLPVGNNIGCDLPEHTHFEIVDLAVAYLAASMERSNYQQLTMEKMQNE